MGDSTNGKTLAQGGRIRTAWWIVFVVWLA
jgi:hypothetical protein